LSPGGLVTLAFKGFTTITNSGVEVTGPTSQRGRAIVLSIALCRSPFVVALAVGRACSRSDRSGEGLLAEAAEPALEDHLPTVALALVAHGIGLIARLRSVADADDATEMKMPAQPFPVRPARSKTIRWFTVVIVGLPTVFFDLSRIASLGAFFYLVMISSYISVFRNLRHDIGAGTGWVMLSAIAPMRSFWPHSQP
jgi:hypothetical protein